MKLFRSISWLIPLVLFGSIIDLLSCNFENSKTSKFEDNLTLTKDNASFKGSILHILCWEGYADPSFTKAFEEKYGVKIKATYFGSSDELVSKLQNGGGEAYDIISPSSDVAGYIVSSNLVSPIDTQRISAWDSLAPELRKLSDIQKDGKIYGLPFTWGPDYLIYDSEVVKEEPDSWKIFFDPKYKGMVSLWDDISNIYIMGQIEGLDKTNPSALYTMNDSQLNSAKQALIRLKPQIRKYWATAGELDNMFKNREVALAVGWPLTVANLNKEGRKLKAIIPKEGATGWIDRLMVTQGSKNRRLAELYLDYISSPATMAKVLAVTHYNVANLGSIRFLTPEQKKIADASQFFSKLNFWQMVKNRRKYNEIWNEVKSAQ